MVRRQRKLVLLQHLLGLRRTKDRHLSQFHCINTHCAHGFKGFVFIDPLAHTALGDKLVPRHRQTGFQRLHRQRPHFLDPAFQLVSHAKVVGHVLDAEILQRGHQRPVSRAGHDGADRLGGAPTAPVALRQRRVRLLRDLYGDDQLLFKQLDTARGRLPTLDVGRLHDDQFNLGRAFKRPLRGGGPHGRSGVEHKLGVLFDIDGHAIAELPINDVGGVADPAHNVSGAKHAGQQIPEPDDHFGLELHLPVRVDVVQRRQCGQQLVVDHVLIKCHTRMDSTKEVLRFNDLAAQHIRNDVVEQGAGVGVDAGGFGRHLRDKRHGARAVDNALGGGPADDARMLSH